MKAIRKRAAAKPAAASPSAVDAVFDACPTAIKARLKALRRLILDTAKSTKGVGRLEQALKWGQPSFLTAETGSGSTIRIDRVKSEPNQVAMFFHCQTDLVDTLSRALSKTQLQRQPRHPARCGQRSCRKPSCATAWDWR